MTYRVVILPRAKQQLLDQAVWWSENRSANQAFQWLDGFERALNSLASNPQRCSLARESQALSLDLRELHYGLGNKPTHRAVFEILGDEVVIYSIRHSAQRDLTVKDF